MRVWSSRSARLECWERFAGSVVAPMPAGLRRVWWRGLSMSFRQRRCSVAQRSERNERRPTVYICEPFLCAAQRFFVQIEDAEVHAARVLAVFTYKIIICLSLPRSAFLFNIVFFKKDAEFVMML